MLQWLGGVRWRAALNRSARLKRHVQRHRLEWPGSRALCRPEVRLQCSLCHGGWVSLQGVPGVLRYMPKGLRAGATQAACMAACTLAAAVVHVIAVSAVQDPAFLSPSRGRVLHGTRIQQPCVQIF